MHHACGSKWMHIPYTDYEYEGTPYSLTPTSNFFTFFVCMVMGADFKALQPSHDHLLLISGSLHMTLYTQLYIMHFTINTLPKYNTLEGYSHLTSLSWHI